MTEEGILQRDCEKFLDNLNIKYIHIHNNRQQQHNRSKAFKKYKGFPDLAIFLPHNKTIFVELKTPTGIVRPDQTKWMEDLIDAGYDVLIIDNYGDFVDHIANHMCKLGYTIKADYDNR